MIIFMAETNEFVKVLPIRSLLTNSNGVLGTYFTQSPYKKQGGAGDLYRGSKNRHRGMANHPPTLTRQTEGQKRWWWWSGYDEVLTTAFWSYTKPLR